MLSKDLMLSIAAKMVKKPSDFQEYIDYLDNQMLYTVDDLRELSDVLWLKIDFPLGVIIKIKKCLAEPA